MAWYYYSSEGKLGPFNAQTIRNLALEGIIKPDTILENGHGQQARAQSVEGLEFQASAAGTLGGAPEGNMPVAPGNPAGASAGNSFATGGNSYSETNASDYSVGANYSASGFPAQGASDEYGVGMNRETLPALDAKKPPVNLFKKAGFWDWDLTLLFGDPGMEVNQAFFKNIAVLMRLVYWIFCFLYWVLPFGFFVLILVTSCGENGEGILSGLLRAFFVFLLTAVPFFFLRLYVKLPLELMKYVMHCNLLLKRIEWKIDNK